MAQQISIDGEIENQFFQVSLKLFIKDDQDKILVLKMPPASSMAGYHDFPGGRISEPEVMAPFGEIVRREVGEELGPEFKWKLSSLKPVAVARHNYPSKKYGREIFLLWVFFEAHYLGGEIMYSDEHVGAEWVKLAEVSLEEYFVRGPLDAARNYLGKT